MEVVAGVASLWLVVAGAEAVVAMIRGLKPVETRAQFEARWKRESEARHRAAVATHIAKDRAEARRQAFKQVIGRVFK